MLLSDFECLLNAVYPAVVDRFRDFFLTLHLGFHLDSARCPCTFQLIIQMAGRALTGECDILTQQIISIGGSFSNQFNVIVDRSGEITGNKLDVVDHFIQQSRIGFAVANHPLFVIVGLQPEIAAGVPRRQLHNKLFIGFVHDRWLIGRSHVRTSIQVT